MFWNLVLEPSKRYSSTVKESFHLSMAALDTRTISKGDSDVYPVHIEFDGQELVLCNLSRSQHPQVNLDLLFEAGSKVTFLTTGKATIHLTGYILQDDEYSDVDDEGLEEEEEEEDEEEQVLKVKSKPGEEKKNKLNELLKPRDLLKKVQNSKQEQSPNKRKLEPVDGPSKKKKEDVKKSQSAGDDSDSDLDENELGKLLDSITEDDDDNEDDFGSEEEESDDESEGEEDSGDEDEGESEDKASEDDDLSEEDDSEDDLDLMKPKQSGNAKLNAKANLKALTQEKSTPGKTPGSAKKQGNQTGSTPAGKTNTATPAGKQINQSLTNGLATPASGKKDKKNNQDTPRPNPQKTPNTPQSQKKQTAQGGVVIEEIKPGNGPIAKPGKMVQVYYTGRLKSNNRVFDQSNTGNGFKFRLGRGEVIKGWDVGLNGMKVGSKRRITCPAQMAYGNKGSPPTIPPNSTLIFDVELRSVN